MNIKVEIHDTRFQRKLDSVSNWEIPSSTKKELNEFIDKAKIGQVQEGKRLTDRTLSKYLSLLKRCLEIINKETNELTKEDIERFDKELMKLNFASVVDYRKCLRIFLRWKIGLEKCEKISGWLDTRDKIKTPNYLSEREIDKLFKNCKNPSERFLIAVLFDSGARIEAFLNIRYEDFQLPSSNENFIKLTLKEEYSKTKGSTISLYWKNSLNSVRDFIQEREEEGIKSTDQVFNKNYDAVRMFLSRFGKRVLNKEVTPHLFRHSSATYYAPKLNRQELCYRYGWKFSSDMPDVYISRAGMQNKELDEKFKSTELEEVQKKFEKEKFETSKESEQMKKGIENLKKALQILTGAMKENVEKVQSQKITKKDIGNIKHYVDSLKDVEDLLIPQKS